MKIWLVTVGEEIPSDPGTPRLLRTGILARHLTERGHDVTWWNATMNHQQKLQRADRTTVYEAPDGYRIALLHGRSYTRNTSIRRIMNHRELARSFREEVPRHPRPDVIICSYPTIELADAVVAHAVAGHIPVAVDFRDMWPDAIAALMPAPLRLAMTPLLASWRAAQRRIVGRATAVIGITDAFVEWALASTGRKRSSLDRAFHLTVDTKAPPATDLDKAGSLWNGLGIPGDGSLVVGAFMGSISRRDDLLAVAGAARALPETARARLRLVYCGPDNLMQDLASTGARAANDPIIRAGWRNAAEIHELLKRSTFGMLPYPSTPDFRMSLPNKVGEYLSAGLPIMTGLKGDTEALLTATGLGLFYEEQDSESITRCLNGILANPGRLVALRPAALAAYRSEFDATSIYGAYADYIEALAATRPTPAPNGGLS